MIYLLATAWASQPSIVERVRDHFVHHADSTDHVGCLTGLVKDVRAAWPTLPDADRAELTSLLGPVDLATDRPTAPPPPSGRATDTCFGQYGANTVKGDHFSVEWDSGISESTAQAFLESLEYAYEVEVEQLGWRQPDGDPEYLMLAYVTQGNYAGAYTTVSRCGGEYLPYIVAYSGSFSGGDWYETMALHEFNHAIQFSYGYGPEFWYWEATATYIEEQVLPNANWWSTYVVGYSDNPYIAFGASDQNDYDIFYHMYGMAIWGFYLDEYQGGADLMRQTWEYASGENGYYDLNVEELTEGVGVDFAVAYEDFVARNTVMDYREHRYFSDIDLIDSVSSLPAEGASSNRSAPQGYGQNYFRFKAETGNETDTLQVVFTSESSVDWLVQLVSVAGTDVDEVVTAYSAEGTATVELPAFGADDAYLVVSPLKHTENDYDYTWTASLVAPPEPPPEEDTATEDTGDSGENVDDDGKGKLELQGCGCATTPEGGVGLGALVALAALVGRRRRE